MNKDKKDILNEKDVIDENTINDDVILSEAKDLADDEIKDIFDEEFELAGITVSEELIAKTMTAIRGLSEVETVEPSADHSHKSCFSLGAGANRQDCEHQQR